MRLNVKYEKSLVKLIRLMLLMERRILERGLTVFITCLLAGWMAHTQVQARVQLKSRACVLGSTIHDFTYN